MSSSLQEQLVQAGLADEDSLNRSRQGGRRRSGGKRSADKRSGDKRSRGKRSAGGNQGGGEARKAGTRSAGGHERQAAASPGKGQRTPPEPERQPSAEEKADRVRQLIRANRIARAYAGVPYRFTQGSRVREIAVTGTQQGRIARGELAVVSDGERCELVPAKVARQVRGIAPEAVLVLNTGDERGGNADDDPYAAYRVPDDLMW